MRIDAMGREFEVRYLRKNVGKGIVVLIGPRGIGKTTLLRLLASAGAINKIYDIQEYLLRANYSTYSDLYEVISESIDGPCGIDNFDYMPSEYRKSDLLISFLEKLEENGAIIATYRRDIPGIFNRLGFKYEVFHLKELSLDYTNKLFADYFPDENKEYLTHITLLSEGYPSAINYYISLGSPSDYINLVSGFTSLDIDRFRNYDWVFLNYHELHFIKRDVTTFNLLSSIAYGSGRPRDLYGVAGQVTPVYLSRLYENSILDKVSHGRFSYYYIRDPILRMHIGLSMSDERHIPVQYIYRYVGLSFSVMLLFIQAQGSSITDLSGHEIEIPLFGGDFRVLDDNIIYLKGIKHNMALACTFTYDRNIAEELSNLKVDTRLLVCYIKPDETYVRRLNRKGVYVIDKWTLEMLSARSGYGRRI